MRHDAVEGDLTDAYMSAPFIPDAAEWPDRWATAARAFRESMRDRAQLDLPYGPRPRNRFDLFRPDGDARGLVVFLHGGYWIKFGREDWSHLAAGALARGFAVAMPSYTLAPEARISAILAEVTEATKTAVAAAEAGAGLPGRAPVAITGHSVGGHMAARLGCADRLPEGVPLRRVVPISPIGDLAPLMRTEMNDLLGIDAQEARAESPIRRTLATGVSAHVWVGAAERPSFLEQADDLARAWDVPLTRAQDRHHYDVVSELARPDSPLTETMLKGL